MKSSSLVWLFVVIIIVAAILYLIGVLIKRKNNDRLDELEDRKIALFDLPVIEEVDEVKKMHLVGQSQNTFREWNQRWTDISTVSFAELESRIFDVENLNETFRFFKVKAAIESAYETMDEMEKEVESIRSGLRELSESEERNSQEVQKALDVYEEIAKELKEDSASFGPALKELQKQVKSIETEFTQFVSLNTSGDPIEARDVLEEAERRTYEIEGIMKRIPPAFKELNKTFPDQVKDLTDGHKKMVDDSYRFTNNNIEEEIKAIDGRIKSALMDLEKCELDPVEASIKEISDSIDELYNVMEREVSSRNYVMTNQETLDEYIKHAMKNNRQLSIELDHTSQSYALNHNELGRSRGFQAQLDDISKRNEEMEPKVKERDVVFSDVEDFYKDTFQILEEIESQQVEIDKNLQELRQGEKDAQNKIDDFEFKLRNMKRYVEKQRLPGLPAEYLEFFFVATERIEELSKELNKIRIDIDAINELVRLCQEDIKLLEQKTNELVDSAALTEQMMQYANRYRHTHPLVRDAIEQSLSLFNKNYRYQDALDEIGTALEKVEPGAFKRIESFYFKNREINKIM